MKGLHTVQFLHISYILCNCLPLIAEYSMSHSGFIHDTLICFVYFTFPYVGIEVWTIPGGFPVLTCCNRCVWHHQSSLDKKWPKSCSLLSQVALTQFCIVCMWPTAQGSEADVNTFLKLWHNMEHGQWWTWGISYDCRNFMGDVRVKNYWYILYQSCKRKEGNYAVFKVAVLSSKVLPKSAPKLCAEPLLFRLVFTRACTVSQPSLWQNRNALIFINDAQSHYRPVIQLFHVIHCDHGSAFANSCYFCLE